MLRIACIAASAALLIAPDVSHVLQVSPPTSTQTQIPSGESIPVLPNFGTAPQQQPEQDQPPSTVPAGPLTEESRLEILRYVSGEFARMVTSLPAGKKGFHLKAGEPLDSSEVQRAILSSGAAVNSGDKVQITKVDFRDNEILVEINGGPNGNRGSWRDHLHLDLGGGDPLPGSTQSAPGGVPPTPKAPGAALYLDFGRPLPNMTPDQVKKYLA